MDGTKHTKKKEQQQATPFLYMLIHMEDWVHSLKTYWNLYFKSIHTQKKNEQASFRTEKKNAIACHQKHGNVHCAHLFSLNILMRLFSAFPKHLFQFKTYKWACIIQNYVELNHLVEQFVTRKHRHNRQCGTVYWKKFTWNDIETPLLSKLTTNGQLASRMTLTFCFLIFFSFAAMFSKDKVAWNFHLVIIYDPKFGR